MPEYRRAYLPGGTFFFTIATHYRRPIFQNPANVQLLREAIAAVQSDRAFELVAGVILPDHMHHLWTLPECDSDYSRRIGRMKTLFTKSLKAMGNAHPTGILSASRQRQRESDVWQRRFWEHVIRDERDFEHHLKYIHYNPVKHGLTACPHAWAFSSFEHWVRRGAYEHEWCCACAGGQVIRPYPPELDNSVGE